MDCVPHFLSDSWKKMKVSTGMNPFIHKISYHTRFQFIIIIILVTAANIIAIFWFGLSGMGLRTVMYFLWLKNCRMSFLIMYKSLMKRRENGRNNKIPHECLLNNHKRVATSTWHYIYYLFTKDINKEVPVV